MLNQIRFYTGVAIILAFWAFAQYFTDANDTASNIQQVAYDNRNAH